MINCHTHIINNTQTQPTIGLVLPHCTQFVNNKV